MTGAEKTVLLFQYIKELSSLKNKTVKNISTQYWYKYIRDIPVHPDYVQYTPQEEVLLTIEKPEIQECPVADESFVEWLNVGWDKFTKSVSVIEKKKIADVENTTESFEVSNLEQEAEDIQYVFFTDDLNRVAAYEKWLDKRNAWAEEQRLRYGVQQLFKDLHRLHMVLERDSETLEFVAGNGTLQDRTDKDLKYPILSKRIKIEFDAVANIIKICDTDIEPQLDNILLTGMSDIYYEAIKNLSEQTMMQSYHPFDAENTPEFLKQVAHAISSDSVFIDATMEARVIRERISVTDSPIFLVRKRMDGTQRAVAAIIENIEQTEYVPPHLMEIVDGGQRILEEDDVSELTLEQQLAAIGGEDVDILLSKEANKEQLEIAQRISRFNAVLVQGPPGTGKTHTIANLLGNFLAEGKSVLVTSHTKKALAVLKEKVSPDIRDLCVSILDDSNTDMERSIDGISDMLARHTQYELQAMIKTASEDRKEIIRQLAETRNKIHQIKFSEFSPIAYCGESVTPSKMATFVRENEIDLSYIPGMVTLNVPLPLTHGQLIELYKSNHSLTLEEEQQLAEGIPSPNVILSPQEFSEVITELKQFERDLEQELSKGNCSLSHQREGMVCFAFDEKEIECSLPKLDWFQTTKDLLQLIPTGEPWQVAALADGKAGGSKLCIWEQLLSSVEEVSQYAESIMPRLFGHVVTVETDASNELLVEQLELMVELYHKNFKIGMWNHLTNKSIAIVERAIQVDGINLKSEKDCICALEYLRLTMKRDECAAYWDGLMAVHGLPQFCKLDENAPEQVAIKFVPEVQRYLRWYEQSYSKINKHLNEIGLDLCQMSQINPLDTALAEVNKILATAKTTLKTIVNSLEYECIIQEKTNKLRLCYEGEFSKEGALVCRKVYIAYKEGDAEKYEKAYYAMKNLHEKYSLKENRVYYLNALGSVAPDWANAIENRTGIHEMEVPPTDVELAWRWKQYVSILNDLTKEPFDELQQKSILLSHDYRLKTAEVAKWRAWLYLKRRIEQDIDTKAALTGWKLTVKKIGKGTGKLAPLYRAEARKQMAKCQSAVPAWIMPMSKALENFVPGVNSFDVVIVDEASQSDISALAITYMAKKVIVVGDDKQVSPLSIGLDITKMNQLAAGTIKDEIPRWQLYTGNTSLYDIVSTVYTALMLKEHFRCVPDIIGYSNWLSYDYKIKPLRDTSDCTLLPAVVNYRVDGMRHISRKVNEVEANTIVAMIKACITMDEYKDKTFGVISLLGDEQSKLIEQLIFEHLDSVEIERHEILCGTSAQFQGDERDIIFLSLVDSNTKETPLHISAEGVDQATKKRYNVAVSRAKDQLWVVNSLDAGRDLKQGDIRRGLLEYAENPKGYNRIAEEVAYRAESPFEEAVGKSLVAKGYALVQQWPVGAYRIDMVVLDGEKKMAIECDGERWHSGEEKLRADMERQTILERLGWRFIRIRGSAYYRNPEAVMESVFDQLSEKGIMPTGFSGLKQNHEEHFDLLEQVKVVASQFLCEFSDGTDIPPQAETIAFALNPTVDTKIVTPQEKIILQVEETKAVAALPIEEQVEPEVMQMSLEEIMPALPTKETFSQVALKLKPEKLAVGDEILQKDVIDILKEANVPYIDKREFGGALWMLGGQERQSIANKCISLGFKFQYKAGGGKVTKGKDGWWLK